MIYLVEAVLPEGYFADDLRGLSADMAAFRDLLRLRLPRLANHMDHLQRISDGQYNIPNTNQNTKLPIHHNIVFYWIQYING